MRYFLFFFIFYQSLFAQFSGFELKPGRFGKHTDDSGMIWQLQNNGIIRRSQTNSFLTEGMKLSVNGNYFSNNRPLLTKDGSEYVLPDNRYNNDFTITRRIKIIKNLGLVRYADIISYNGLMKIDVKIEYNNRFSSSNVKFFTSSGVEKGQLSETDSGCVVFSSKKSEPVLFFNLKTAGMKDEPSLDYDGSELVFSYNIPMNPGQTICLLHGISLKKFSKKPTKEILRRYFSAMNVNNLLKTLPESISDIVYNVSLANNFSLPVLALEKEFDKLAILQKKGKDTLIIGDNTRLFGKLLWEELFLQNNFGKIKLLEKDIYALCGKKFQSLDKERVFFNDGQIILGKLLGKNIRFVMNNDVVVALKLNELDRIIFSSKQKKPDIKKNEGIAFLETSEGNRLIVNKFLQKYLSSQTNWGSTNFSIDELSWFENKPNSQIGSKIALLDDSNFLGIFKNKQIALQTKMFKNLKLPINDIKYFISNDSIINKKLQTMRLKNSSYVRTKDEQTFSCQFSSGQIIVIANETKIPLPLKDIKKLSAIDELDFSKLINENDTQEPKEEKIHTFKIELWDDSKIYAVIDKNKIDFKFRGKKFNIPANNLLELNNSQPYIAYSKQQKIKQLINKLSSENWQTRENASLELKEFGQIATPQIKKTLKDNPDFETRSRLEEILKKNKK